MTPRPARSSASRDALLVALLTVLALALRVARLDFQPLWWDEGYSVWFAHHPLGEMLRLTALDIHPPLYYALLGGWGRIFGFGPVALRLLSVAIGVLAVPLAYVVATWLAGRRAGLVAALLLAVNPFHVYYSQEIRMYGLVLLWSLLAIGCAARAVGIGERGAESARDRQGTGGWWLAGYGVAMVLALATQYYAGFLAVGLAIAGLVELWRQRRLRNAIAWLGTQGVVALLFLPWVLFAGPKLVSYVSQKIIADSDKPLAPMEYLARHLSAYAAGHLEGPLAPWWLFGLIGVTVLGWGLWRLSTARTRSQAPAEASGGDTTLGLDVSPLPAIRFLTISLAVILFLGWLVNLTFPFFPDRGERLLLLGLPLFILLVAIVIAALWTESVSRAAPSGARKRFPLLILLSFLVLAVVSLAAFYSVARYKDEDYRPLIGQVTQWGRAEDAVFAVYPWQVGYFWSYGSKDGPQPLLSPAVEWTPEVSATLDGALARGHVWFPEHLSLGGAFENAIEAYLGRNQALLTNRWYSSSTRLSGWTGAQSVDPSQQDVRQVVGPFHFSGLPDETLESLTIRPQTLPSGNQAILVTLQWGEGSPGVRFPSLRLIGPDGRAWAQQDYTLDALVSVDRLGLLVPTGTPPGEYTLELSLLDTAGGRGQPVEGPGVSSDAASLDLGKMTIAVPQVTPPQVTLPIEQPLDATLGDALRLIGVSAPTEPQAPGEDLLLSLFWQALPGLSDDLFVVVQLLDDIGQVAAAWEGPIIAWRPTSVWRPGELIHSKQTIRLPAGLPDGRYRLVTGVFDPASGQRLAVHRSAFPWGVRQQASDTVPLGVLEVAGRDHVMTPPQPQTTLQADLARAGRLVGYDLPATQVSPGDTLDITLHWQATESTGDRLAVFVHLLDAQGEVIGQSDGEPGDGAYPTSGWIPGEYLADRRTLAVRTDAAAGRATLVAGLYDPITGARVSWLDAAGEPAADSLRFPETIDVGSR